MNRPTQILLPALALVGATLLLLPGPEAGTVPPPLQHPGMLHRPAGGGMSTGDGVAAGDPAGATGGSLAPVVVQAQGDPEPDAAGPAWQVGGRVVDPLGWPVVGAEVSLRGPNGAAPEGGIRVRTDVDGAFALAGADPAAIVDLWVEAPEFATAWVAAQPELGDPVEVVLRPALPWVGVGAGAAGLEQPDWPRRAAATLAGEGFVEDGAGQPVPGALVTVAETGRVARSDATGRFRVALPGGPCTLMVQDRAGRLETRTLPVPERNRGLVPLPRLVLLDDSPGRALRGIVRDPEGEPLAGGAVRVFGPGVRRTLACDAQGRFGVGGLPAGEYRVVALPHQGSLAAHRRVDLTGRDADFDLALAAARPLELQVVDEVAEPVGEVHVAAWSLTARTGAQEEPELLTCRRADGLGQLALQGVGGLPPESVRFEVRRDTAPLEIRRAVLEPEPGALAQLVVAAP